MKRFLLILPVLMVCLSGFVYPKLGAVQTTQKALGNPEVQALMAILEHETANFVMVTSSEVNHNTGMIEVTVLGGPPNSEPYSVCKLLYDKNGKQVGETDCHDYGE